MEEFKPKIQMCSFCKNHGRFVSRKGHKECPHKDCTCGACGVIRDINRVKRERAQQLAIDRQRQGVNSELSPVSQGQESTKEVKTVSSSSKPIDLTFHKKEHTDTSSRSRESGMIDLSSKSYASGSNKPDPLFRKKLSDILPSSRKPISHLPARPHDEYKIPIKTEPVEIKREPSFYGHTTGAASSFSTARKEPFDTTGWTLGWKELSPKGDLGTKNLSVKSKATSAKQTNVAEPKVLPVHKGQKTEDKSAKFTDPKRELTVHDSHTTEAASSVSSAVKIPSAKATRKYERGVAEHQEQKSRKKSVNETKKSEVNRNVETSAAVDSSAVSSRSIFGKALGLCKTITSYVSGGSSVSSAATTEESCSVPLEEPKGKKRAGKKRTSEESTTEIMRKKPKRFCPRCGESVGKMDNFCAECCFRL